MSHILDPLQQLEPSLVRILVSLPWDAAQRLRQLANDGNPELRALNIQSVQFEGDSVITLKAGGEDIKIVKLLAMTLLVIDSHGGGWSPGHHTHTHTCKELFNLWENTHF